MAAGGSVPDANSGREGQGFPAQRELAALAFDSLNSVEAFKSAQDFAKLRAEVRALDLSDPAQRRFGDYELLEQIGEGGMGVVYRARQLSLDREVAVKLLAAGPWASHDFIARFDLEARSAARMQHPNIVTVYEVGTLDGLHFFSMRLVDGMSLAALFASGKRFEPRAAALLLRTITEAVAYAHSLGVLHLDLKPANVLLDGVGVPYVADFGLSRRLGNALAVENEEISGTPAYMAPEQAVGHAGKLMAETDVWGLGAILYELVSGHQAFRAKGAEDTLELVLCGRVRSPRRWNRRVTLDLEAIILKCLKKDPAQRYPSARALADDLQRYIEGRPVQARPLNTAQKMWRWGHREPHLAAFAASFAIALVAGLIGVAWQWRVATINAARADHVRAFLVGVLKQANPDENKGRPVTAKQLLDYGARELDTPLAQSPAIQSDLASTIGTLYLAIGDDAQADAALARARRVFRKPGVPDDVKARVLDAFALAEKGRHQFAIASTHAREALTLAERAGDAADASEARRLEGETLFDTGHARTAERLLRTALATDRARVGNDADDTIDDLILLGAVLHEQSRFDESLALTREAASAATRRYGRENSKVIAALDYQARSLKETGRSAEAVQKASDAATLAERLYGPGHRITLAMRSNLGSDLRADGRYAEALQVHLGLLPVFEKQAAERPKQRAYGYASISADYLGLGDFAKAETAARESLTDWRRIHHGVDAWDSAVPFGLLGESLQWQGRYAEAEAAFRRELALEVANEAPNSAWLNQARGALGSLLCRAHRCVEAEPLLQTAFASMPAKPTPIRAVVEAQLATVLLERGNLAAAQVHAANALAAMRQLVPTGSVQFGTPLVADARARLAAGDATHAESLAREAVKVRSLRFSASDPRLLETEVVRVEALRALNRDAEATALASKVHAELGAVASPIARDFDKLILPGH